MHSKPFAFLAAGAIAALIATGCAKGSDQSTTSTTTTTGSAAPAAASTTSASSVTATSGGQGDAAHGKAIFSANCAGCHGANGVGGGIGPTLKNEKSRKNLVQAIVWIKNPQPPMPKLYPATLNEQDVNDVAAYVQTL
jgi:mono/diheme cytochrome c family protein